jgi:hypothetical protein
LSVVTLLHSKFSMHPWLLEVLTQDAVQGTGDILETNYVHHLADVLQREGVDADWNVVHDDDRAQAIVEFAASGEAPIVALATSGRGALDRLRAASVTVTVARSATCPVLVIGPAFAEVAASHHYGTVMGPSDPPPPRPPPRHAAVLPNVDISIGPAAGSRCCSS